MRDERPRSKARRLTTRHILIILVYIAVMVHGVLPFLEQTGLLGARGVASASLLISFPLLAFLEIAIDAPGPSKNWLTRLLVYLFYPVLALSFDVNAVAEWWINGYYPSPWAAALFNVGVLPLALAHGRKFLPRVCPSCGQRMLIPLLRLFDKDQRTARTGWCACCGAQFWKAREGEWRLERRHTWLDGPKAASEKPGAAAEKAG